MTLFHRTRHAAGYPRGARRRVGTVLPMVLAFMLGAASVAYGAVWTDQDDYTPGSVVTISGDNSDAAGYLAGETVVVDVAGPNGFTASCSGVADAAGAWTCQITLWSDELAIGDYTYTATGQTSGVSESGEFTDGHTTTVIQSGPSGTVSSTSATFTWKVFSGAVELSSFQSQCSLDGAAFASCASGVSYAGLSNGAHTFTVRSRTGPGDSGSWGTSATRNWTINADSTPPTVTIALNSPNSGTPDGLAGWFKTAPVSGTVTAEDTTSNIASIDCDVTLSNLTGVSSSKTATGDFSVSAEGTTTISCTAKDAANNTSNPATTHDVKIDTAAPNIVDNGATVGPDGNAGWYISAVINQFSASDPNPGSGLAGPANFTKSSGTAQGTSVKLASGAVSDVAGNSNSGIDSAAFMIDLTNPSVTCGTTPTFVLNQAGAQVSATVTDGQSGPAASPVSGSASTSAVGSFSAGVTGYDVAGRSATVNCSYNVIYSWNGFFKPVDNLPVLNVAKAGSAIPVKFSLNGNQGLNIFAAGYPKSIAIACPAAATPDSIDETVTASTSGLSYDAANDQYNYVWKTTKTWSGCRQLQVMLNDGQMYTANFQFTK